MDFGFTPIELTLTGLLYEHDCVIVPGWGGFVGHKISGHFDKLQGVYYPPFKRLVFNPQLNKDDGLFLHALSLQLQVPYAEARKFAELQLSKMQAYAQQHGQIHIERLGIFRLSENKHWVFEHNARINFLAESFGLMPIKPVKVEKLMGEPTIFSKQPTERHNTLLQIKKALITVPAAAAAVFALLLISNPQSTDTNGLGIFNPTTSYSSINLLQPSHPAFMPQVRRYVPKSKAHSIVAQISSMQVYIISAHFKSAAKAELHKLALQQMGFEPELLPKNAAGFYRIAYGKYQLLADAEAELAAIQAGLNEQAYLLVE